MIEHPTYNGTDRIPADRLSHKVIRFLEFLFADAITDVGLVARELGVRDEMRERLRRALDRLACVQMRADDDDHDLRRRHRSEGSYGVSLTVPPLAAAQRGNVESGCVASYSERASRLMLCE